MPVLTGTIIAEGEIPEGAIVKVTLNDVSLMDVSAKIVAITTIHTSKEFPISFSINYDNALIESRNDYSINVRIEDPQANDQLLYINDTAVFVLTKGYPSNGVAVPVIKI
ncbi:hypothetical protein ACOME3_005783 [Neoechinorhynchus agilis]